MVRNSLVFRPEMHAAVFGPSEPQTARVIPSGTEESAFCLGVSKTLEADPSPALRDRDDGAIIYFAVLRSATLAFSHKGIYGTDSGG